MYVTFEIAALFPSPNRRVKKRGSISKQTYIWTQSSHSYIVLALVAEGTARVHTLLCFLHKRNELNSP